MKTRSAYNPRFVFDGHEHARTAIRAAVFAEYRARWSQARIFEKLLLWFEIEREIDRRAAKQAPWDALY